MVLGLTTFYGPVGESSKNLEHFALFQPMKDSQLELDRLTNSTYIMVRLSMVSPKLV